MTSGTRGEAQFNKHYKNLNPSQKEAVDTIEGPVMVIAGPGTGKTQILTLRIANILRKTDTAPDNILALTFTESAAYSMRRRLVEIIGERAYRVKIYTFHGFANEVIKQYPEEFERIIGSRNITEVDQVKILREIIDNNKFKYIKPYGDPYFYLTYASSSIRELKREAISIKDFEKLIKKQEEDFEKIEDLYHEKGAHKGKMKGKWSLLKKSIDKNKDLLKLYKKYEEELREKRFYDFEDMIGEVLKVLSVNEELLLEIQENHQYILADEHQDTNNAQNKLLELLGSFHDNPNLFVVGDEKQAIYRFQGASLENFLYFKDQYPEARIIFLEKNYRSGQRILDASFSLIEKDNDKKAKELRKRLEAFHSWESSVIFYRFLSEADELSFIASNIQEKLKAGTKPQEIAILYRNNNDAFSLAKALDKKKINYNIESNQNILDNEITFKVLILLRALNNLSNDELLSEALYLDFLGIRSLDVHRIIATAKKNKKRVFEVISQDKLLKDSGITETRPILDLARKLEKWASLGRNKHFLETFEIILNESGILLGALRGERDNLIYVDSLYEEARKASRSKAGFRLPDFIEFITLLEEHKLPIKKQDSIILQDAVRLMTAHKAKGQEFETVYITGLVEGRWGGKRRTEYFKLPLGRSFENDPDNDERKLFYVALTRAKKESILTSHMINEDGRNLLPSKFIEEIDDNLLQKTVREEPINKGVVFSYTPNIKKPLTLEKDYLISLFEDKGLSVSALNNYLECPWKYFFESLIRLPSSQNRFQQYGTAVHEAISDIAGLIERGKRVNQKIFLDRFYKRIEDKDLSDNDLEELKEKGGSSLPNFYDQNIELWKTNTALSEVDINGIFIKKGASQPVLLRGRLDRLEINPSGKVKVIDFKTSKPKTKNQILGNTRNSEGNLYRQLIFYKILLDGYQDGKYDMHYGEIIFTEPDEKGRYKKEIFEIDKEEALELKEEIFRVAEEIRNFDFYGKTCGKKDCRFCKLSKLLPSENSKTIPLQSEVIQ